QPLDLILPALFVPSPRYIVVCSSRINSFSQSNAETTMTYVIPSVLVADGWSRVYASLTHLTIRHFARRRSDAISMVVRSTKLSIPPLAGFGGVHTDTQSSAFAAADRRATTSGIH